MPEIGQIAKRVRSKNAGPFWLTIDIFCANSKAYARVQTGLATKHVAAVFQADVKSIKRYEITALNVIKFSLPRPSIQGSVADRDMHGASWAALVSEIEISA